MKVTKELAEILGMFAADGCLQDNYICMWGNIFEDKDYYDKFICPLFSKVFNKRVVAHEKKSNSVYGFYICDKNIIQMFKDMGFTKNKTYSVKAPKEIIESRNREIYAAFIRGFTDCDGCISFMRRKGKYCEFKRKFNTYPKITVSVTSKNIIKDMSQMLAKLGLHHTVTSRKSNRPNEKEIHWINVRGNIAVERWMEKIGLSNPSKINKYLIWKKYGMCPKNMFYEQGKRILQGELNPFVISERNAPNRI